MNRIQWLTGGTAALVALAIPVAAKPKRPTLRGRYFWERDDTPRLQAYIDECARENKCAFFFPGGRYTISKPLVLTGMFEITECDIEQTTPDTDAVHIQGWSPRQGFYGCRITGTRYGIVSDYVSRPKLLFTEVS